MSSGDDTLPTTGRRIDASEEMRSAAATQVAAAPESEAAACATDDTWDNGILDDAADGRHGHTAIWTGTEMIVWG